MKKILIFLITFLSIFSYNVKSANATIFYYCNGSSCASAGSYTFKPECEWAKGVTCYEVSDCSGQCATGGAGYYWGCGTAVSECNQRGYYSSKTACESATGAKCYFNDRYCNNECVGGNVQSNYYGCKNGTCQLLGSYLSDTLCRQANATPSNPNPVCWKSDSVCGGSCGGSTTYQYCDTGALPMFENRCKAVTGNYASEYDCAKAIGKTCYKNGACSSNNCYQGYARGWKCSTSGTPGCIEVSDNSGLWTNWSDCSNSGKCNSGGLICNNNGICEPSRGETNANCPNDCKIIGTTGWACTNGTCQQASGAPPYATQSDCLANCKATQYYTCIPGTWSSKTHSCVYIANTLSDCQNLVKTSYTMGNGQCYSSQLSCDSNCSDYANTSTYYYCSGSQCLSGQFSSLSDCTSKTNAPSCFSDATCYNSCSVCNNNGTCEPSRGENSTNCPECVPIICNNNGTCEPSRGETNSNCPYDCRTSVCNNNKICEPSLGENSTNCSDCTGGGSTLNCNNNKICEPSLGENYTNCPDCTTTNICNNNSFCEPNLGETSANCIDCQTSTGCNYNKICEPSRGENSTNCPDCTTTGGSGWNCNASTKQCVFVSSGANYSDQANCSLNCSGTSGAGYYCNSLKQCVYTLTGGVYSDILTCNAFCNTPTTYGYQCNTSTGFCDYVSNGSYADLNSCNANCRKSTSGYNCDAGTGSCYQVMINAQYQNSSSCSLNCRAPYGQIAGRTLNPSLVTQNSARFNGQVTNRGGYSSLEGWFRYYKKLDGIWMATGIVPIDLSNGFYFSQAGLEPDTEYCYLAVIQIVGTTNRAQGEEICFKTSGTTVTRGYNCISGACTIGSVGQITDYPDAVSCTTFCRVGSGWKCNSDGSCSQTSGPADYNAENACNAYCKPQPRGYNCVSGMCAYSYDFFTDYPDLASCSSNCKTGAGYDCNNGTCSPVTNNADYQTLNACNQYCESPITGYNCIEGECNQTSDFVADYPDENTCSSNCKTGAGWVCNPDGTCTAVSNNGHYSNEQACKDNCEILKPTGYNCVLGTCQITYDVFADYPNQNACSSNCSVNSKWTCNIGGTCSQVAFGGDYNSQAVCGQYCIKPVETIIVRTDQPSAVNQDSARLNGTLIDNGGRVDLEYFFRYQKQGDSSWLETNPTPISSEGSMFANISNLEPNTQYCYYAIARIIDVGTEHRGSTICFTTNPLANLGVPILIHPINDEIETNTLINFDWTDVAGAQVYEIWERFGTDVSTESVFYASQSQLQTQINEIGRHYWKARACIGVSNIRQNQLGPGVIFDGTANCGAWSETETFIIANNNGITCTYSSGENDVVLPIDISACSMNVSFFDPNAGVAVDPNTRLRVGDVLIMNIGDPGSEWSVGDNSMIRHDVSWIANAQTAYSQRTPITPHYPYSIILNGSPSFVNVGVAATNPFIQDPDMVTTTVTNNLSITRTANSTYRIVVLGEGTGNIDLNVGDIFSYATVNGEVCGHGFVPGCSRSYSFTLQGDVPIVIVPGDTTSTTTTIPGGTDPHTTSTCISVSKENDQKIITRINRDKEECKGEIDAIIYDVGRDEILNRDIVKQIEVYQGDDSKPNNAPKVFNLRNNRPDWCSSQSVRLEWDYSDPDNDLQKRYKINIYIDGKTETYEGTGSNGYSLSLVGKYGKEISWDVEVWDDNKDSLSAKADLVTAINIPKHQYPTPSFEHNEVQIGSNDIEYKVWFSDKSTAYNSDIKKYEWDFNGDGKWDKVFDTSEKIQTMKDHPETQMLYTYDPDSYTETILRVTDSDDYTCEYRENVIPEDFKYEDYSPVNLNQ
jgi:hypothetical protein